MRRIDQIIIIAAWIVVSFLCFQVGVIVGGEKARNSIDSITPKEADKIQNDISLTEAFMSIVERGCREEKQDLANEVKIWRQRYDEQQEKKSNDDSNDCSRCNFQ